MQTTSGSAGRTRLRRMLGFGSICAFLAGGSLIIHSAEVRGLAATSQPGQVVFEANFDGAELKGWAGPGRLDLGRSGGHALAVERDPNAQSATMVSMSLPVEALRGGMIRAAAMVKAADVTAKPQPWNGIKFMLALQTPTRRLWPQADISVGSFDWQRVAFSTRIPADATNATLVLGLEGVGGKAWFDDVRISLVKAPRTAEIKPVGAAFFKGHDLPRLRGAMISPSIDPASLRVLGVDWKANLLRWQLIRHGRPGQSSPLSEFDTWADNELRKLDAALPFCEKYGIYVALDLHSPPGGKATVSGYIGSDDRLFTDPACQAKFVEFWARLAARYKDAKAIWGYDLANEPVEDLIEDGCDDWQGLAERAARAIRAVDPARAIIVEPAGWGGPDGLTDFEPLGVSNVVYSVHMYMPHAFTHQGVHGAGPEYVYPGMIEGKEWNKEQLEAALKPVVEFQRKHKVHFYLGEFSAIRWAPDNSACRYLKDLIDIFEAHGWDWSYHAFREWSGWSVEHGPERRITTPAPSPTDRQRLLMDWFARNKKPAWASTP
ncbi:MAG: glycoside hydrolase family 5 protein [Verrucomicrobiia bacterium]